MEQNQKAVRGAWQARLVLFLVAALLSVVAVLLFYTAARGDVHIVSRILAGIGGALAAVVGAVGWLVFLATLGKMRGNLFLYDRATKTDLPIEALTWELVRGKLDFYFRIYLGGRRASPLPEPLRPLLMPYFLLTFLDSAPDGDWDRLLGGDKRLIDEFSDGVRCIGLEELGNLIQRAYGSYTGDVGAAKAILAPHRDATERALLDYIREHITDFDQ